jgi:glycosyltransferase involved in cell wall biosynthesis
LNYVPQSNLEIAIIIPALNEELTIAGCIKSFHSIDSTASIWVVNNGSTDNTRQIALDTLIEIQAKGGIIDVPKKGKGNAIRAAFHELESDIYVVVDADLTYPAESLMDLVSPIQEGKADIVVGDRISSGSYKQQNIRLFHGFGNFLVQRAINVMYRSNLSDIMTGYRAMSRLFVKTYPITFENFEIETDMTLHALDKRFRLYEVPITYKNRPEGSHSKLSTYSDGFAVLLTIFNILRLYKPLFFYFTFGIIIMLIGIIVSIPALYDWYYYSKVTRVASAVLAASIETVGIICIFVGLILDATAQNSKRHFELNLHASKFKWFRQKSSGD